jgi:hypothetical protein
MPITKEERTIAAAIRTPQLAVAAVEGFYKGERAVFLCLPSGDPLQPDKADLVPVAMLLRGEDIGHVTRPKKDKNEEKLIITTGR